MGAGATETCSRCGASFGCGMGQGSCWCAELPNLLPVPRPGEAPADGVAEGSGSCLCPTCLREEIARRQAAAS